MADRGKGLPPESVRSDAFKVTKLPQLACGEPFENLVQVNLFSKRQNKAVGNLSATIFLLTETPLCHNGQVLLSDPGPIVLDLEQLETTSSYGYIHL